MSGNVTFFAANDFLEIFSAFRVVKIGGRFGGGKTALGVMLGAWLQSSGKVRKFVSNVPTVFNSPLETPLYNAAIMLDESWQYLESRADVLAYAAFLRKFNHYLILPTIFPIHRRLDFFEVQRVFNAYAIGIPAWVYRWSLSMGKVHERGYFSVFNPHHVFGLFDTEYVPGDDAGIADALVATSAERGYKKRSKYADILAFVEANKTTEDGTRAGALRMAVIEEQIEEAVNEVGDAAGELDKTRLEIQTLSKRVRR